jgi:hypothetical protein
MESLLPEGGGLEAGVDGDRVGVEGLGRVFGAEGSLRSRAGVQKEGS